MFDFEKFCGAASGFSRRRPPTIDFWTRGQKVRQAVVKCEKEKNEIKNIKMAKCAKKVVER